jgi:hypothetical protein
MWILQPFLKLKQNYRDLTKYVIFYNRVDQNKHAGVSVLVTESWGYKTHGHSFTYERILLLRRKTQTGRMRVVGNYSPEQGKNEGILNFCKTAIIVLIRK